MSDEAQGYVRLSKENIELRQKLAAAQAEIDELRMRASQSAVHVFHKNERHESSPLPMGDRERSTSQANKTPPRDTVDAAEYDRLEGELEASQSRERELQEELDRLKAKKTVKTWAYSDDTDASPSSADKHEIARLRKKVEALEAALAKERAANSDLNDAMERLPRQSTEEVSAQIEQDVLAATAEYEAALQEMEGKLKVSEEAQRRLREELKRANQLNQQLQQERDRAAADELAHAIAEKSIAVHVKEEALRDAAAARTANQKLAVQVQHLKSLLSRQEKAVEESSERSSTKRTDPEESPSAMQRTSAAANERLRREVADLAAKLEETQRERDKALQAGKRAFVERQNALKDLDKVKKEQWEQQQIANLQQKSKEDVAKIRACFKEAASSFSVLEERLSQAQSPEEWRDIVCEILFDYERRIWNLNNEILSLNTIVGMREKDTADQWVGKVKELQDEVDFLRSNLRDTRRMESELKQFREILGLSGHAGSPGAAVVGVPVMSPHR
jgi:hypothetical protein